MIATKGEGFTVVELETFGFGTTTTVLILEGALIVIALVHRALDSGRDVAGRRRRVGFFQALSGSLRLAVALGFELLEFLGHGFLDYGY